MATLKEKKEKTKIVKINPLVKKAELEFEKRVTRMRKLVFKNLPDHTSKIGKHVTDQMFHILCQKRGRPLDSVKNKKKKK